MNLITLHHSPQLHAYYDTWNNWLFLDWQGALTLLGVQQSCLELLHCCCAYPCQRVLNSNVQVQAIAPDVIPWVGEEFVPYLQLAGIEQLAWVGAALPAGQQLVRQALAQPTSLDAAAFHELEAAVEWLQQGGTDQPSGCGPCLGLVPADRARREHSVSSLIARVSAALPEAVRWPENEKTSPETSEAF